MNFLSVCSGIEAASLAWTPDWQPVAYSEIDPFACSVLDEHHGAVSNWGDMTKYKDWPDANFSLLVGGTPCQSFSIAGFRKGINDPRGRLMLTYGRIAERYRPRWLVWENVCGVLSQNKGRDFGSFLWILAELGYGFAYRVLDAQYFGVPQRRRRVFVVGYLGDWRRAAAVLFEKESLHRRSSPSSKPIEEHSETAFPCPYEYYRGRSTSHYVGADHHRQDLESQEFIVENYAMRGQEQGNVPEPGNGIISTIRGSSGGSTRDILAFDFNRDAGDVQSGIAPSMSAGNTVTANPSGGKPPAVCFSENQRAELRLHDVASSVSASQGFKAGQGMVAAILNYRLRRMMPIECERLQGLPDNYTAITFRGKPASNSRRYKAIGNSIAVPVLRWLKKRIELVDSL